MHLGELVSLPVTVRHSKAEVIKVAGSSKGTGIQPLGCHSTLAVPPSAALLLPSPPTQHGTNLAKRASVLADASFLFSRAIPSPWDERSARP